MSLYIHVQNKYYTYEYNRLYNIIYIYIHVLYIYIYICIHTSIYIYVLNAYVDAYIYICIPIYIYTHSTCIYTCLCIHMYRERDTHKLKSCIYIIYVVLPVRNSKLMMFPGRCGLSRHPPSPPLRPPWCLGRAGASSSKPGGGAATPAPGGGAAALTGGAATSAPGNGAATPAPSLLPLPSLPPLRPPPRPPKRCSVVVCYNSYSIN